MEEAEAELERAGYEPGLLQNKWRVFYLLIVFLCMGGEEAVGRSAAALES